MTEPVRLAKRIAEMVPCSRSDAERYIEGGWVSVDGVVVNEPESRVTNQTIVLHPDASPSPVELVTFLVHQPAGLAADELPVISIDNRATDDNSGIEPLKRHFSRQTATLPLQPNAGGLAVFTQDWRVVRKLVNDAATVEQEYVVEVAGEIVANGLKQLNHGIRFNGKALPPAKVSWQNETRLRFAVKAVQHGQITHMCQAVGLRVISMKRIRIGKISMGKLPIGQWRYLPPGERF